MIPHLPPQSTAEVLPGMREQSVVMILDFNHIDDQIPDYQNIQRFFEISEAKGINPRLPENRQRFNNEFLQQAGQRYLIGRYGEDRLEMLRGSQIAAEGRTIHLGVDLFCSELEQVHAPLSATVVRAGQEAGSHTYGYYVVLQHQYEDEVFYTFYGHLSANLPAVGTHLQAGESFAQLGDYERNENGGWSRHLHFQLLTKLPQPGQTPIGYSTPEKWQENTQLFPDPQLVLALTN